MCRISRGPILPAIFSALLAPALALPIVAGGGQPAQPREPLPPGAVARWGSLQLRHVGEVSLLAFSADGKSLLSLGSDLDICRWDAASGKELTRVQRRGNPTPKHVVYRTEFVGRGRIPVTRLVHDGSFAVQIAVSHDGKLLAELTRPGKVQVWEIATGKEVRTFEFKGSPVHALAFSPDGKFLAAGDREEQEGVVRLCEVATGKQLRQLKVGKDRLAHSLLFSPDGLTLAGAVGNEIRIWDVARGKRLRLYQGHEDMIVALAFSPDGKTVASAGRDQSVRLWEPDSEEELLKLAGPECPPLSLAFSPNGRELATGWQDTVIRVWEVASGAELRQLEGHRSHVSMLAYSPDGKTLASADGDGTMRLWSANTGKPRPGTVEAAKVAGLTLLDGGRVCALRGEDGTIKHVEVPGGKERLRFRISHDNLTILALAPNGLNAAFATSEDGSIRLWDGPAGKEVAKLTGHPDGVAGLAYSRDGKLLASAGADGFIKVWVPATGKELFRAEVTDAVHAMLFSADDRVLAAAVESDLCLWETTTGKLRLTFRGVSGGPGTMALSADGRLLATGPEA
ncbi:MAG: hypothetical protein L0Z62_05790 [Gemmataceae bacterium]|nr:hypothetical protein [Gemmataceae bacterium]